MKITPFTIDSYDDVIALWQQCDGIGLSSADSRENIHYYLERNPGMSFIATINESIVGAILAGHDGRRWQYIPAIAGRALRESLSIDALVYWQNAIFINAIYLFLMTIPMASLFGRRLDGHIGQILA